MIFVFEKDTKQSIGSLHLLGNKKLHFVAFAGPHAMYIEQQHFITTVSRRFLRHQCYKVSMTGLLIGVVVWMVCAAIVATVLGRVAHRGDSEELGSTIEWNIDGLDREVQHEN
ncbi:hypothetical protein VF34_01198 [Rhodococcus sp. PML026]|nr:hypothetical protein VF34_01198 [Rhodococcus sp. PML026]